MTRFRLMTAIALVQVMLIGGIAFAQGPPAGRRGGGPGFGGPGMELRGLQLSEAQRTQVRDIAQRHREEMRNEIFALLTPEQQTKAKELEANREARLKQRLEQLQQRPSR